MNAYICDRCQRHQSPEGQTTYAPKGWFTLTDLHTQPFNKHFCSATCLRDYAEGLVPRPVAQPLGADVMPMPEAEEPRHV